MSKIVEFYFDFASPTAYLAYKRLLQIKAEKDFELVYKPVLLGGLFKATGNTSPVAIPAKGAYMLNHDLPRYAAIYQVQLNVNPNFPINTLPLMRAAVALDGGKDFDAYLQAVFQAMWVDGENMGDPERIIAVLQAAGLDSDAIVAASQEPEVKAQLITNTEAAVERGVFGVPTLFMGDAMYFGQDRLHFIEQAVS